MAIFNGTPDDDFLAGGAGDDSISGLAGNDTLLGGAGNDTIDGGEGNDIVGGGTGNDSLTGGGGTDFVYYGDAAGSVQVNLATGTATGAGTDTLAGFEGMRGSEFADTLTGSSGDDRINPGAGNDSADGGAGTHDRIDYGDASGAVMVDLSLGSVTGGAGNDTIAGFEDIGGTDYNDTLAGDTAGNILEGGPGNDSLAGGDGNDTLMGGEGADTLRGGAGNDSIDGGVVLDRANYNDLNVLNYSDSTSAINLNLSGIGGDGSTGTGTVQDGLGGTDTVANVNFIVGSGHNDTLTGSAAGIFEQFEGGAGNDIIDGGAIDNGTSPVNSNRATYVNAVSSVTVDLLAGTATGGAGNDTLTNINHIRGSAFNDVLSGTDTTDHTEAFDGQAGNDTIDGRGGIDQVRYDSGSGAVVNLGTGTATDGLGGTDTLSNIENVRGSNNADQITGSVDANVLDGRGGNDLIAGGGGADSLLGNDGDDTLSGGAGIDTLNGGNGYDRVSYAAAAAGVVVNMSTSTASNDGDGASDVLVGIERVIGSQYDDSITGSAADDDFTGGQGNDVLDGGAGFDFVSYGNATSAVQVDLAGTATGGEGNDSLTSIEAVAGSRYSDSLLGTSGDNYFRGDGAFGDTLGGSDTMNGLGGFDVVDYRDDPAGVTVNLQTGLATDGHGLQDTLLSIEEARGSTFNDVLTGSTNLWFERFEGREGNDTIDGGAITDTLNQVNGNQVSYRFATAGVAVDLLAGTATGGAGNDSLSNINEARGSAQADTLLGSNRSDVTELFEGRDGDDFIDGRGGFDIARFDNATGGVTANLVAGTASGAGVGNDTLANVEGLWGSVHADILTGGNAANGTVLTDGLNEFFLGGGGNDTIDGGQGYDLASYQNSTSAVTVTLNDTADGTAGDGFGGTDTLRNIEGVRGSAQNDTLTGSDTAAFESFEGREGNDVINGKAGLDRADYYRAKGGVTVNLGAGSALDGYGGTDSLSNIEDVRGSRDFNDSLTGDGSANKLEGLGGNDTLDGGAGNDTLIGGDGDDNISGLAGNDSIVGSVGNDWLTGGLGNDSIDGGAGWDTANYGDATAGVIANLTTHLVTGGAGADTLAGIEALVGTNFNDNLTGDTGDNNLRGGGGNDTLTGDAGNDVLTGGLGSDTLAGGLGAYDMADYGDATAAVTVSLLSNTATGMGTDVLSGIENLAGGNFNDTLTGDGNANYIQGNGGDDSLAGGAGSDWVGYAGTLGAVQVNLATNFATGAAGNDVLSGFEGIRGSSYNDTLIGNTGDNQFNGAQGDDTIDGGAGIDMVGYWEASGAVAVNLSTGASSGADGNDSLIGIENVVGSNFDDTITGDGGNNNLVGGLGNDLITGGAGVDTVAYYPSVGGVSVNLVTGFVGGAESDTLGGVENVTGSSYDDTLAGDGNDNSFTGGLGNDSIQGGAGNDWANYYDAISAVTANLESGAVTGGAGVDTLSGIEHLGGSSFADTLTGSAGSVNNTLRGEGGNDSLVGNDGNDYLTGGSGNDTINGGTGADTADYFFTDTSAAVVVNLASGTATGGGGTDTLTSIENVNGGSFNDAITGDAFNNFLQGQGGNDTLTGAAGDDKLDGGLDNDSLVGGLGNDSLIGDAGNDTLLGNEGADTLSGGGGNDSMDGGLVTDRIGYSDANTATYLNSTSGVNIDLSNVTGTGTTGFGTAQDGMAGVDTLVNISFIVGSGHDDTIVGSTARIFEMFEGGAGNDTIDGGAITDTLNGTNNNRATYVNATGAVTVDLEAHWATGGAGDDTLLNINQVRGGAGNDTLLGSNHTDYTETFEGRGGNDSIDGRDGFDIVRYDTFGGATSGVTVNLADGTASGANIGTDILVHIEGVQGGSFNDTLIGGNPDNGVTIGDGKIEVFRGAGGSDSIDGGQGYDRVDYNTATNFVTVTLGGTGAGTASDGLGGTDTLVNIEAVRGSDFGDTLNGSDTGVFESFEGMAGADRIDGKLGVDRVDYGTSAAGVTVNLTNTATLTGGTAADGWGSIDTLFGIENVRGSTFNDSILGSSADNRVEAGTGVDTVDGAGGNDTLAVKGAFLDYMVQRPTVTDTRLVNATTGENVLVRNVEFIQFTDGTKTLLEIQGNSLSPNNDVYVGDEDDNNIDGLGGNDSLSGLGGNDTLIGGAGIDTLIGGTGNDTYVVDVATDQAVEVDGEGTDTVNVAFAAAGTYSLVGSFVENATVTAGAAIAVNLTGNELNNVLTGNAAANILTGGDGNDTLDGGAGTDNLIGGAGNDSYVVNVATDVVNETLSGGGSDTVDVAFTALGTYIMTLGVENAFISTSTAGVNVTGSVDNNLITGNTAANLLNGATGNDTLEGGAGNDTLDGGLDDDRVVLAGSIDEWAVTRTTPTDTTLTRTGQTVTIRAVELVQFDDATVDMVALWHNVPTPFNDVLTGSGLDNLIDGLAGNDTITGMDGNDTLIGGAGIDTLIGGTGNDTYVVDVATDQAVEVDGEGTDTVNVAFAAAGTYSLVGSFVENATVTAGAAIAVNLTGNELNNVLTGNAAANILTGGDGNDTLDGGAGTDNLIGGAGNDSYVVNVATDVVNETLSGGGSDTVDVAFTALGTYIMTLGVENAFISTSTAGVNVTGSVDNNLITGNATNNILLGNAGNDTLAGGMATGTGDTLDGGAGDDLVEMLGNSTDTGMFRISSSDTRLTNAITGEIVVLRNVENVHFADDVVKSMNDLWGNSPSLFADALVGTEGPESIDGQAGNDTITGLGGDDTLIGGLGADSLVGGDGNDLYVVDLAGVAGDLIVESAGEGNDTVNVALTVAGIYTMGAEIENGTVTAGGTLAVGIIGNVLDNVLTGNANANALTGGDGNDTLAGNGGNDTLTGGAGNDGLDGGAGTDSLAGGAGDDAYTINLATDVVTEALSAGTDTVNLVFGAAATYTMTLNVENANIANGTSGVNITGNLLANALNGNAGNNILIGGDGNDTIAGNGGSDVVDGGLGTADVVVFSGSAEDYLITRPTLTQTVFSRAGVQVTVSNVEFVQFDAGGPQAYASVVAQTGSPGNDALTGFGSDDTLDGGAGNDTVSGLGGDDTLFGGIGNDTLAGGAGTDILDGGAGIDTYVYEQGDGDDLIDQNDTVAGVIDRVVLTQAGLTAGQVTFTRGYLTYDDLVVNIEQADESVDHVVIVGFFSNDAVSLGTIDQVQVVIDGVAQVYTQPMLAAQALLDGDGDHIFVGYNIADNVTASAANDWISTGNGNDVVNAGEGDDVAFGGAGADQLNGGDGNDLLVGGAGADTIAGGAGNDTLSGGAGGDLYRIEAGGGDDVISESIPSLTDEQLQSGIGPLYVIGDGDAPLATDTDTLSFLAGIAEADVRATRSGNDLVFTIGGADTVTVANYFANGVATIERVQFASGATWSATAIRAKVLVATSGDDEITGYLGGDRLNGLGGNDTLDGREGNDVLTGGDGNDVLTGGSGSDRFVFNVAPDDETNLDTITDFQSGVDTIVLSAAVFTEFSGAVGTRVGLSDNLTYDNGTGALAYDADGAGAGAAVTIAIIGAGPHPASLGTDFVIGA